MDLSSALTNAAFEAMERQLGHHWCRHCGHGPRTLADLDYRRYFLGRDSVCPNCGYTRTLYRYVEEILFDPSLTQGIDFLLPDVHRSSGNVYVSQGTMTEFKLSEIGVPDDAIIDDVWVTAVDDGASLVLPFVSLSRLKLLKNSKVYSLTGKTMRGGGLPGRVQVMVLWYEELDDADEVANLISAIRSFRDGRFESAVISANTAIERELSRILHQFFENAGVQKQERESFVSGIGCARALTILAGLVSSNASVPDLPVDIARGLREMNKRRNKIAHVGERVTDSEARRHVLNALFGWTYLRLYGPGLSALSAPTPLHLK